MPTLNWIGKNKVINYHNEVPYRITGAKTIEIMCVGMMATLM